jgi:hypothetical protein
LGNVHALQRATFWDFMSTIGTCLQTSRASSRSDLPLGHENSVDFHPTLSQAVLNQGDEGDANNLNPAKTRPARPQARPGFN